jgi:hypothetical protein
MIVVCGCSFSSRTKWSPGTHWSDLLETHMSVEITNLALRGASQGHIRLQLETALGLSPKWVIVNATKHTRLEMPIFDIKTDKKRYELSDFNNETNKNRMTACSLGQLATGEWNEGRLEEAQRQAVNEYMMHLYDPVWKKQMDSWLLNGGLRELRDTGIKVICDDSYFMEDTLLADRQRVPGVHYVDKEYSYHYLLNSPYKLDKDSDPGYHVNAEAQKMLAEYYASLIADVDNNT